MVRQEFENSKQGEFQLKNQLVKQKVSILFCESTKVSSLLLKKFSHKFYPLRVIVNPPKTTTPINEKGAAAFSCELRPDPSRSLAAPWDYLAQNLIKTPNGYGL